MSNRIVIYHNPHCSKSRQTLALLTERGIEPEIVEYLTAPPSANRLDAILKLLGKTPEELMRKNEKLYKELGLKDQNLSRKELIKIMAENPILIERPIVVNNDKAAVGRPPESVLDIL